MPWSWLRSVSCNLKIPCLRYVGFYPQDAAVDHNLSYHIKKGDGFPQGPFRRSVNHSRVSKKKMHALKREALSIRFPGVYPPRGPDRIDSANDPSRLIIGFI